MRNSLKKVVAFVPVKLNSQRIPRKNLLPIGDKPMVWHIVNSLLKARNVGEVYVFCSDEEIIQHIPKESLFLKRDKYLDLDEVKGEQIYDNFINKISADIYVLAHTTSPFLKSCSIEKGVDKILNEGYDSSFSAKRFQTFSWYSGKPINYELTNIPRTQDILPIYVETSGYYAFVSDLWTKEHRRIGRNPFIQEVDNFEAIDIDEPQDYDFAQLVAKKLFQNEENYD
jgi:CMP-N-acetylneuraminic acid synthetase